MSTFANLKLIACHDCDLLHRKMVLSVGQSAACTRCGALLYQQKQDSLDRTLMISLAGLIFFILANFYPFMAFKLQGQVQENTLIAGVRELYSHNMLGLSVLVFGTSILIPLIKLLGMVYILLPLKFGRQAWKLASILRALQTLHPWAMMEVYMLGVLVAYVKLSDLATILPGIALYSFATLIIITVAADYSWDSQTIWEKLKTSR